ncbi:MAG: PH domain-containing protein [Spirochaetia bacterium]
MTYSIQPPAVMLFILIGVAAVVVLSLFLKKGEWKKKLFSLGITVVVIGVLIFVFQKPVTMTVSDQGVTYSRNKTTEIPWNTVDRMFIVEDYMNSPYRARLKTNGTAVGEYRTGWFKLENGDTAKLLMEQDETGLVLVTGGTVHILGPDDFKTFIDGLREYLPSDLSLE